MGKKKVHPFKQTLIPQKTDSPNKEKIVDNLNNLPPPPLLAQCKKNPFN